MVIRKQKLKDWVINYFVFTLLIVLEGACSISFIVMIRIISQYNGKHIRNMIWLIYSVKVNFCIVNNNFIVSVAKKNVKAIVKIMLLMQYEAIVNKR